MCSARPPVEQVNQAIRDVLVRKPARFFDVTVEDVEREECEQKGEEVVPDISSSEDNRATENGNGTPDATIQVDGKMMSVEEMGQMKVELHQTLGYVT